jgi:hypothetical protein
VNQPLLELDARGRAQLGRYVKDGCTRYLVNVEDDGTIVLTPAVVMSAMEASILADPDLTARIQAGLADAETVTVDRG